ncbi:MAG: carboxylating nicotinate-nucleotide diphosphorylase [Flavobacteriales bacterium]|jgi:nicotinate-nucleotide pyrophosphorylase (carboxylating)|nr:carboxylating nicotinate-nucleotide diphosphorylase [Flavobacteriales bacterium]MBK7246848.1 carboxylating nicotinate-nucleotide diphosphorylase [Flavobacteriales bacterium]MBK7287212.1 carboxylating nicotinate-nucleotide diphosphorylase [Flavobacteriales bacterium]QQS72520.1 MAG: carboxylating nicotinate-nucleotide diphosphorylase [Flavobacteriales bacterium]HQV39117.1 carboxylating nicotinate-nucleotide diphosphorylase [Flavobacteriales bacterium]
MLPPGTEELIDRAFAEDVGDGDHTSLATIPGDARGAAHLLVKANGVIAGIELAKAICDRTDEGLHLRPMLMDGARVVPGDVAFTVNGNSRSILLVERVLLNFMQRMSGIATLTRAFVDAVEGTKCSVLDTRKTTPGLRAIEKWAVLIGGGTNHRQGLYDMMMIKDNHADFAGGISQAITRATAYQREHGMSIPIEVETRDLIEVGQVLSVGGVQRIMLDNFDTGTLREAVEMIGGRFETEASGGITLDTARSYAECGVDFISVGALTHSAVGLDMSLKAMG